MKKLLALVLALVMVLGLFAGCGNTETTTTTETTTETTTTTQKDDKETGTAPEAEGDKWDNEETLVFTLFTPYLDKFTAEGITMYSQTWFGSIILDKFNIDFELVAQPEDKNTYYMNALAGGDTPAFLQYPSIDVLRAYYDAGALHCIEDYAEYLPDFMASYGDGVLTQLRALYPDGKMWSWGGDTPKGQVLSNGYTGIADITVQGNLIEEYGLDNIPYTLDEWTEFFKTMQEKYPTAPDGTKIYSLCAPGTYIPYFVTDYGQVRDGDTVFAYENTIGYSYSDGAYYAYAIGDSAKAMAQWFNTLNKEGLLDPESFTTDSPQQAEKAASGYCFAIINNAFSDATINAGLESIYGDQSHSVIQLPFSPNGAEKYMRAGSGTGQNLAVTTAVAKEDMERICAFLNFCRSEEGLMMYGSGVEGVDYEWIDGVRTPIGEYAEDMTSGFSTGYAFRQGMWESYSLATIFGSSWGDYSVDGEPYRLNRLSTSATQMGCNEAQLALYDKMGWETYVDWWNENTEFVDVGHTAGIAVTPDDPESETLTELKDVMLRYSSKLVFAEDFDAVWDEYVAEMEAGGINELVDFFNNKLNG